MSKDNVEVGCSSCSKDHLITVAASLSEAARMAKNRPISDPEIQERINNAECELDAMERYDLSPEKLAKLPVGERNVLRDILNKARSNIRHHLEETGLRWGQGDVDDLENAALMASNLSQEFRERITPFYVKRVGKIRGWKTTTGQTNSSDNSWAVWVIGGAFIGFIGYLLSKKKQEGIE